MPREYLMTWEHKRRRWAKMYKGKRYTVTPSILSQKYTTSVPESQDGSYQYANAWWKEKKAEIDAANAGKQTIERSLRPAEGLFAALIGVPLDVYTNPVFGGTAEESKALGFY